MVMTWSEDPQRLLSRIATLRGSKGECLLGNNTTTIVFIPEGVSLASRAKTASLAISGGPAKWPRARLARVAANPT